MYATIIIAIVGGMYLLKRKMKSFTTWIYFNNHFPIALMLPIVINFEKSFVIFHKLLFSNDYWVFDPEKDPIILMLPEEFLCMQRVLFYYLFYVVA